MRGYAQLCDLSSANLAANEAEMTGYEQSKDKSLNFLLLTIIGPLTLGRGE